MQIHTSFIFLLGLYFGSFMGESHLIHIQTPATVVPSSTPSPNTKPVELECWSSDLEGIRVQIPLLPSSSLGDCRPVTTLQSVLPHRVIASIKWGRGDHICHTELLQKEERHESILNKTNPHHLSRAA